ncbi:MAG: hypothetical protein Q4C22_05720 [Bacillota bacterium]|nr:hypothetical protein [Bacillota bacterium]
MERCKRILEEWNYPKHAVFVVSLYALTLLAGNLFFLLKKCRRKGDWKRNSKRYLKQSGRQMKRISAGASRRLRELPERMKEAPALFREMPELMREMPDKAREMAGDIPERLREVPELLKEVPGPAQVTQAVKEMPKEQKIFNAALAAGFLVDMTLSYLAVRALQRKLR